jgi:DNA-binding response OmpR family regulator
MVYSWYLEASMTPLIVVIEDDQAIQSFIQSLLLDNGFSVRATDKGTEGLQLIQDVPPDLVVLDLQLPDMQGESICLEIKKQSPQLPVIMLTAKSSINEKVQGFNAGADDYVTKPFVAEELLARIRARLRSASNETGVLTVADLEMDTQKVEVKRGGKSIKLTPHEFKLLEYLMQNKGIVLSREMILNKIWSYSFDVETRVVDVYMGYLRKKIDAHHKKKLIQSVRGFGYCVRE